MENTVLLVVDVQTALISYHPYNAIDFIGNIAKLISTARGAGIEVIYVRHNGGEGSKLERDTEGWEILHSIAPAMDEKVFDKNYNSAFRDTGLKDYLDHKGIKNLILAGMQTEYCIDATCKVAFEYGYAVIIPADATTTFNNNFSSAETLIRYYEEKIWNKRFADVISVDEALERMKGI